MENNNTDETYLDEYRNYLISSKQQSQDTLDKFLISLSSGALGISIVFITNVIKDKIIVYKKLLFSSWLFFTLTILIILFSFISSIFTFNRAINQTDADKIYEESPGGIWNIITIILNVLSIIFFITGLILLLFFVLYNF